MKNNRNLIHIDTIKTECIIGVYPEERKKKQPIKISLTLATDLSAAAQSDNVDNAVDYAKIEKGVLTMTNNSSFNLIERLADAVADICLDDRRIEKVRVLVKKPKALKSAKWVGVEIVRSNCHSLPRSESRAGSSGNLDKSDVSPVAAEDDEAGKTNESR